MLSKTIITDIAGTSPYLVRWTLRLPFGLTLKLHQIVRSDEDRCPHDHPWWFVRLILWGGYWETFGPDNRIAFRRPGRLYWCAKDFRHRITGLPRGRAWTLVLCGPRVTSWGFYTNSGFMPWKQFVSLARSARVLWCDDGRTLNEVEPKRGPSA